ncbi:LysM peptidoglycan-binding domain-containing protein [Nocardioides sp. zg-ZUI104]|uniref:LysM peptidoglycan-binding domain-containing protein n=1 Tax=Nocardioides faecalis TaxID=2803858 RepID=UPI001BCC25CC|nr:LysM peptidoglycan-binding domain-containing protein [Nocardioides faecalis]MBS4751743.1 LysM peptidoglycan-binding domain-containing protein [Nocardioides faecalis]
MSTATIAPFHTETRVLPAVRQARAGQVRTGSTVRLTRRGRVVVLALALVVIGFVAVLVAAGSVATWGQGDPAAVEVVTVAPGETLWAIASDVAAETGTDVRSAMQDIQQLNTLSSSVVYAGQELRIPTR